MKSACPWMVLLPAQTFARRQDWVMAVNNYMSGTTVRIRATAKSSPAGRAPVRLLLAEPHMTFQCPIGEQMGQAVLLGYQRSSFRTVCPKTYPMVVCTVS